MTSVRYCILCGHEIGDMPSCANPDCQGLPNFYLDVPGPQSQSPPRARRRQHTGSMAPSQPSEKQKQAAPAPPPREESEARQTISLEAPPVAVLRSEAPDRKAYSIFAGVTLIGARPPAQIIVDRPEVSSRHARIECLPAPGGAPHIEIVDAGSKNGTYVNGKRVERSVLQSGDTIRFATAEYVLEIPEAPPDRSTIDL